MRELMHGILPSPHPMHDFVGLDFDLMTVMTGQKVLTVQYHLSNFV